MWFESNHEFVIWIKKRMIWIKDSKVKNLLVWVESCILICDSSHTKSNSNHNSFWRIIDFHDSEKNDMWFESRSVVIRITYSLDSNQTGKGKF